MPQSRRLTALKRAREKNLPELKPEEWDFSSVPRDEILECQAYEYLREFLKTSASGNAALRRLNSLKGKKDTLPEYQKAVAAMNAALQPRKGSNVMFCRNMDQLPWLELRKQWKLDTSTNKDKSLPPFVEVPILGMVPTAVFQHGSGLKISLLCNESNVLETQVDATSHYLAALTLRQTMGELDPSLGFGVFTVDWNVPQDRIKKEFAAWLEEEAQKNAPAMPAKDRRKSKDPVDIAVAALNALGAYRLRMTGRTAPECIEYSKKYRGDSRPIYQQPPEYSIARKTVGKAMAQLFAAPWTEKSA